MGVGKRTETFLPGESARNPSDSAALNGENDMDVNLCVGVGHNVPLLRELTAI
jgi:hypothetical protein